MAAPFVICSFLYKRKRRSHKEDLKVLRQMIDERLERKNTQPYRLRVTSGLACLRTKCGQLNHNHWYINGYEPFSNPVLSFFREIYS